MLIYRNGIYKDVPKSTFIGTFKKFGFVEVVAVEVVKKLTPKQLLQEQASKLDIEYVEDTTVKELKELIKEAQKDGEE